MTEREELEEELQSIDGTIKALRMSLVDANERRSKVWMKLNRARRLEREELQNAQASRN